MPVAMVVAMLTARNWSMAALRESLSQALEKEPPPRLMLAAAMLFLSTAIVPASGIPERFRMLFYVNPLSYIIDQARDVALWGRLPDFAGLGLFALGAFGFAWLALAWFHGTRRGFADVL